MNGAYLIIGGNMGDRMQLLKLCREYILEEIGSIAKVSGIYETAAWGKTDQASFLNQVLWVHTKLDPVALLRKCLYIEKKMGRERLLKWESRLIDIDILFYENEIIKEEKLTLPHPFIHQRRFVLVPLNEIASDFIHPVLHKSIFQILKECDDALEVVKVSD